ncbi:MAG: CTAG/PCC1 family protein [Aigarchaeota archaeon]|nr:CTAG/PCC1 family protein [Candidatus Wolframiiraptor gerlachensis]
MQSGSGAAENAATHSREEPGHHSQRSRFEAEIILHLSKQEAETIYRALLPEARDIPSRRVSVEVGVEGEKLILRAYAMDPVALRAALNSFIRFIDACLQSIRSLGL